METINKNSLSSQLPKRLRAKQVANLFGIGLSTVWLYAQQKKLTPIHVSSRVTVFDTDEVLSLFGGSYNG